MSELSDSIRRDINSKLTPLGVDCERTIQWKAADRIDELEARIVELESLLEMKVQASIEMATKPYYADAVAAETERCAKVLDDAVGQLQALIDDFETGHLDMVAYLNKADLCVRLAAAIRKGGE